MRAILKLILVALLTTALIGCNSDLYQQANDNVAAAGNEADQIDQASTGTAPPVVVHSSYYVNDRPVQFNKTPPALRQTVSMQASNMPLDLLMTHLLGSSDLVVTFDNTIQPKKLVSLNYSGALKGALDDIAEQTNYAYTLFDNHLNWSAFATKTFNISFMPGVSSYSVGGSFSTTSSASTAGGSNTSQLTQDSQYSNLTGNLSIWQDLTSTLNQLKSKDGEVMVSQASTTVTVRDYPNNVNAIAHYIANLNHLLSQQVELKVKVIEIDLNKSFDYGIDWNLVNEQIGRFKYGIEGSAGTATALGADATSDAAAMTSLTIGTSSSGVLLKALSQQGKLSVVTQPTVVTLNNQIASIRITQDTGYLQSLTSTVANSNEDNNVVNSINTTITPGTVTDGFVLYILPKIQDGSVYLQITSTISNLLKLQKVSTAPTTSDDESASSTTASYEAIQVPTLSSKQFNIRSKVQNGATLVIAGFKNLRSETDEASPLGIQPLGGQGADTQNVQTLILITPVIVKSPS